MSEFPLTDEAVEAAAKALYNRDWAGAKVQPAWDEQSGTENGQSYREEARVAITAFLQAEGFEVETDQTEYIPVKELRRLVGLWREAKP